MSITLQDLAALANTKPITTLPRALIPVRGQGLQPPLMHYGWIADERKLHQYALDHDLIGHERFFMTKSELTGDEDPKTLEPCPVDPENYVIKNMPSHPSTMKKALNHIVESVGINHPLYDPFQMRFSAESVDLHLIVLYTNWHLRKAVKQEQVDAFVRRMAELGMPLQGKPKWYLDFYNIYWTTPGEFDPYYNESWMRCPIIKTNALCAAV